MIKTGTAIFLSTKDEEMSGFSAIDRNSPHFNIWRMVQNNQNCSLKILIRRFFLVDNWIKIL